MIYNLTVEEAFIGEVKSSKIAFLGKALEPYVRRETAGRRKNGKFKERKY